MVRHDAASVVLVDGLLLDILNVNYEARVADESIAKTTFCYADFAIRMPYLNTTPIGPNL